MLRAYTESDWKLGGHEDPRQSGKKDLSSMSQLLVSLPSGAIIPMESVSRVTWY